MKKKVLAILMAVAVVGMYTFGSVASVFAADSTGTSEKTISASNVTWEKTTGPLGYTVYHGTAEFVIPSGTEGTVKLDYRDALNKFFALHFQNKYGVKTNHGYSMPGDWYKLDIKVVNESGHEYKYVNGSFTMSGYSDDLDASHNTTLFSKLITWGYTNSISVNNFTATRANNSANTAYAVSNYASSGSAYAGADSYFASVLDLKAGQTSSTIGTQLFIDGPNTGNVYAGADVDFTSTLTLAQVPDPTTYSVVANYYTSTNGGEYALDGTETKTASADTTVGSEIKVTPEDAWATYNGNTYGYDAAKSTVTKTAVLDSKSNVLTVNYYRTVNTTTTTPTDNNTTNGGTTVDTPSNNNTAAATKTKTGTTAAKADNNNSSAPKTGDTSDLMAWSVLGLAGIVLAGAAVAMRKREE